MNWADIENAVVAWVKDALGLQSGDVILARQGGPRPDRTYATVAFVGPIPRGAFDHVERTTDLNRDPGEEIEYKVVGWRELGATVQIFTEETNGATGAQALASKVMAAARLPSNAAGFLAAGMTLLGLSAVRVESDLLETEFEGRAILDARFLTSEELVEYTGYIASLEITLAETGDTITVGP